MFESDDFSGAALSPVWQAVTPAGTGYGLGTSGNEAYLTLDTGTGNHDIWGTTNDTARIMQVLADADFTLETRFLTTPTAKFQMQGFLIEAEADTWMRFDTYSDGSKLYAFAAVTIEGSTSVAFKVAIPGNTAPYLRLTRDGDLYTFEHSQDGETWTTAGNLTQGMTVTAGGVYAGNVGSGSYSAQVDYVEIASDPLTAEDGVQPPPDALEDALATPVDTALTIAATDLLANDFIPDAGTTLTAIGAPSDGTLTDNGDGTWTYTPDAGFQGLDAFSYTISDGNGQTDTATVTLTVGTPPPPSFQSDDFSDAALSPAWQAVTPAGTGYGLGTSGNEAYLTLDTGTGNHDIWGTTNDTARIMQVLADADFTLETRFLTTPTAKFQMQGFLIEAEADTWMRFDTYSDGSKLYAFAAVTIEGSTSVAFKVAIPGNTAPYLRLTRDGDLYTFEHSQDGETWTTAGNLTQGMTVTAGGVYAGNVGSGSYSAQVDYVEIASDPLTAEDGVQPPPDALEDALATPVDTALTIAATDLLANDFIPDAGTTLTAIGAPSDGTLTDNGDGTWTYTPDAGFQGLDAFSYTISDGNGQTDTATVTLTVGTPPPPSFQSDDFSDAALSPAWQAVTPAGTGYGLGTSGNEAYLTLDTGTGNHDIWGTTNDTARIMQVLADADFTLETRFLTTPTAKFQMQGFLIEAEADTWMRFDTYSDGSKLYAFAAVTIEGSTSVAFKVAIPGNTAPYLRLTRDGDLYTFEHSQDGETWTTAGNLTQGMTVTAGGVYAGNVGSGSYSAQVDYVEIASDPLTAEDGVQPPPDALEDALATPVDTALTIAATDLLANDFIPDAGTTLTAIGAPSDGTLTDNGDGTWTYTPDAGFQGLDAFSYTISDGNGQTDTATVTLTVGTPPPPSFQSDDFSDAALSPAWQAVTPAGTGYGLGTSGNEAYLTLDTGTGNHDIWGTTNDTARIMQVLADADFTLETRFLTTPTAKFQMQGFLIEAEADTWMRFDTYSDGSKLYAFAAVTIEGSTSVAFKVAIPGNTAPYLRLTRDGDLYTFEHSQDGETWTTAGNLTQGMTVTAGGVYAGNVGSGSYSAQVDYVEIASDPLTAEDGVQPPPDALEDALATPVDTALTIAATDLLANDFIPDAGTTLTAIGAPSDGTLTDNGDGTWTYTPDAGFQGLDAFSYTISDGNGQTDTATVTLTVGTPPPPSFQSDDFSDGNLAVGWDMIVPTNGQWQFGGDAIDAFLELQTGNGNFDLWGSTRNAITALQAVSDEDLALEVRFMEAPQERHQMQGFLIQQDQNNWMRFDLYHDGSRLYAFAAVTVDGSTQIAIKETISPDSTFLRVERTGDDFDLHYSADSTNWTLAGSVTHAIAVAEAGLFAGSVGSGAALTARVDYVSADSDPIADEDGDYVPAPAAPTLVDDDLQVLPDTPLVFTAEDLLGNDWDINGDPLTITGMSQPGHGQITDQGDGTYLFTPEPGYEGLDAFSYTVTDGSFSSTGNVSVVIDTFNAVSDDFSAGTLNPVWQFAGISGDVTLGTLGDNAIAIISSPEDIAVSASDVLTTPRLMQNVHDLDFQISAGFLSEPTVAYEEHGLLVVADDGNWLRFDLAKVPKGLVLIVGSIENGYTTYPLREGVEPGEVQEFRITRMGDQFTFEYRGGGSDWIGAHAMERAMSVTQVGAFAGSATYNGNVPGYRAYLDYFENSLEPILNEDGGFTPQNYAPVATDDSFVVIEPFTFHLSDLSLNDLDPNVDDPLTVTSVGSVSHGTLTDNGDGTYTYTPDSDFDDVATFDYVVSDGSLTDTGTVFLDVQNVVDVWFGDVQTFGSPGEAQEWINILGTVSSKVVSLSYSLNGGPSVALSIGPDTRRLHDEGDFNIDIAYAQLDGSAADDIVTITATLSDGRVRTHEVTIEYEDGAVWDPNYSIDWSTVIDLQDVVQVVDGTWSHSADGVRPIDLGYDRLVVFGDASWDNYRLTTSVTGHDLENEDPRGRDGGAWAIGMLWGGHTDDPIPNWQPKTGWHPGASFFYTDGPSSHSYHDYFEKLGGTGFQMVEGVTYNVMVEVSQTGIYDRVYSLKLWEFGAPEPVGWTLQTIETFSLDEAPATGGIYLNAHYYDVTFGDIQVTEITGSDIVNGTEGADVLAATDTTQSNPGAGEVDVFTGGAGTDTFVLGDATTTYYNNGFAGDPGLDDYAFVWDFDATEDTVQLHGTAAEYELREDVAGLTPGSSIWWVSDDGDELVGVLNSAYGLSLSTDNFVFVDDLLVA